MKRQMHGAVAMLVDREAETAALQRLLAGVREGTSGVLVLRGETGIGKTALLDWAAEQAAGMHVARVVGIESEMELSLAALHQLLSTFLPGVEHLPTPQRQALQTAFGLMEGPVPDRFLVGLAALTLITDAAAAQPVLCVVDDAQWLDRASTELLGFVARRLYADRVGVLFGVREPDGPSTLFVALPQLVVRGLPEEAARDLLARSTGRFVGERVGRRLVAEAAGNPLAVVEFAAELTQDELVAGPSLGRPLALAGRLEQVYEARLRALPDEARMLLLLAAASQVDDPEPVQLAAEKLGIGPEAAGRLGAEGLVSFEPRLRFRHPLLRSAAYYSAPLDARRQAHEALAAVADPTLDPDRRAWNLALAAAGPDEGLALELERSAERARARGGLAAGAAFLERAAELTPEPVRRGERMLRAAEARLHAGAVADCRSLLARAVPLLEDPFARAMARRLKGFVLEAAGEPLAAITTLVQAATMLEPYDTRLSRATLLDAVTATWLSGSFSPVEDVLRAVCSSPTAEGADAPLADLLLEGFAAAWAQRYDEAVALLGRAMKPFTEGAPLSEEALRHSLSLVMAARMLYERSILHELEHRFADELRGRGALVALISTLVAVAFNQIEQGRFTAAEATIAEGRALSEATGFRAHLGEFDGAEMSLLAWRGREVEARALADRLLRDLTDQGHDLGRLQVHDALAQLDLGLGNYPAALRSARAGVPSRFETVAPINLVEAAMRSGEAEAARCALESFSAPALASATDFDLGMLARCEALLVDEGAEANFRLSVELLQRAGVTVEVARSQLLYGEWLRRQGRRRDAREQLHRAVEKFDELGMEAFGQRARAELRATGQHLQRQAVDQSAVLTPQESQIALLAAQGATNREIAAKLFISSATVDYHLRKVFRKLGVTTRVRLAPVLAEHERVTPQPS